MTQAVGPADVFTEEYARHMGHVDLLRERDDGSPAGSGVGRPG
ncbi:MAG TPA: hypothetical protein VE990_19565 [Acidimicrobiales bacterium]|nr:hypothetical protein [Acidimicrobiales bacterium]